MKWSYEFTPDSGNFALCRFHSKHIALRKLLQSCFFFFKKRDFMRKGIARRQRDPLSDRLEASPGPIRGHLCNFGAYLHCVYPQIQTYSREVKQSRFMRSAAIPGPPFFISLEVPTPGDLDLSCISKFNLTMCDIRLLDWQCISQH